MANINSHEITNAELLNGANLISLEERCSQNLLFFFDGSDRYEDLVAVYNNDEEGREMRRKFEDIEKHRYVFSGCVWREWIRLYMS